MRVLLTRVASGDPDAVHGEAIAALKAALPNVRWVSSYRTRGSVDFVDVLHLDDGEVAAALGAFEAAGAQTEVLEASASASLAAPGFGAPGA